MKPHTEIDSTNNKDSVVAFLPQHYAEVWVTITESLDSSQVMLDPEAAERLGMALIRLAHKARKHK